MLLNLLALLAMLLGLFLIPLGLPGLWVMILALLVGVVTGAVPVIVFAGLVLLGLLAEIAEFVAVSRMSARAGGSRLAFWAALGGGLVGALVGVPIPIVGPLIGGVLGTFLGALAVTALETREMHGSVRVGWGAALGRGISMAIKVSAGIVVLLVGGAAMVF